VDAATGRQTWSFARANQIWSTPDVANGMVYCGSGDGAVYALDQHSGRQVWSYKTGGPIYRSSPTLANGLLYIASQDKAVYALVPTASSTLAAPTATVMPSAPRGRPLAALRPR
jgi:outer membrane protein assembly factor BamB